MGTRRRLIWGPGSLGAKGLQPTMTRPLSIKPHVDLSLPVLVYSDSWAGMPSGPALLSPIVHRLPSEQMALSRESTGTHLNRNIILAQWPYCGTVPSLYLWQGDCQLCGVGMAMSNGLRCSAHLLQCPLLGGTDPTELSLHRPGPPLIGPCVH